MAAKKVKKNTNQIEKVVKTIQTKVKDINTDVLTASEEMIDDSVKLGAKWQNLFAKTLKNGTELLGNQQEVALDSLEAFLGQVKYSDKRLRKLLGVEGFSFDNLFPGDLKQVTSYVQETVAIVSETAQEVMEDTKKEVEIVAKKVVKQVNTTMETANPEVKAVVKKVTDMIETVLPETKTFATNVTAKVKVVKNTPAKKATTKTAAKAKTTKAAAKNVKAKSKLVAKKTAKAKDIETSPIEAGKKITRVVVRKAKGTSTASTKVAAKTTTTKTIANTDLRKIEGIGPKIEQLLKAAGITTFEQLAAAKKESVKEILLAAGSRYRLHDPSTWAKQADLAAKGNWDALNKLQAELKGGKKA